jgi:hypothetical protein
MTRKIIAFYNLRAKGTFTFLFDDCSCVPHMKGQSVMDLITNGNSGGVLDSVGQPQSCKKQAMM